MAKITFIARMTVKPEEEARFLGLCKALTRHVRQHETDVLQYEFYKLREKNRYAILESFPDEAVEHRHMKSAILAELAPQISACLDGTWVREYLDAIE